MDSFKLYIMQCTLCSLYIILKFLLHYFPLIVYQNRHFLYHSLGELLILCYNLFSNINNIKIFYRCNSLQTVSFKLSILSNILIDTYSQFIS